MGEERELLENLSMELRRGTLVLSVLSRLHTPKYGYALVQGLEERGVAIDPNTLYPLLRRLERQGLLESKWETNGPKPRKYYRRTAEGDRLYTALRGQWGQLSACIDRLLREEEEG